jgi:dimethylamine corrinoid protein
MKFEKLTKDMGDLNEPEVMAVVRKVADSSSDSVFECLKAFEKGMEIISARFDDCEYFVSDLIFAGEIMTHAVNILGPALKGAQPDVTAAQKIIICTVEGDLHDIGKNIVKTVMEGRGVNVIDLGVNLSPDAIVQRAIAEDVRVIALSGVLTSARESMKRTVEAFRNAGIRDKVKIIVGGSCVDKNTYKTTGADAWAVSARESADICCAWLSE